MERTKKSFSFMTITNKFFFTEVAYFWLFTVMKSSSYPYFLTFIGSQWSKILNAIFIDNAFVVKRSMVSLISNNKIFNAIVSFYAIDVMNNFTFFERSFNVIAHYKNMLTNIPLFRPIGMTWSEDMNITTSNFFPAFPIKIVFSPKLMSIGKRRKSLNTVFVSINYFAASAIARIWRLFKTGPFSIHSISIEQYIPIWQ